MRWVLWLCVLVLFLQVPLSYYSSTPIIYNDLEIHTGQARMMDTWFHTWWDFNRFGGGPAYLMYPPLILLFTWSNLFVKLVFLASLLLTVFLFYQISKKILKYPELPTVLYSYLLLDQTHNIYYPGITGIQVGLFGGTLALVFVFLYWLKVIDAKESPLLLSLTILANPIVGVFGVLLTFIYLSWKKVMCTGIWTFLLTAWWVVPYLVFSRLVPTPFGALVNTIGDNPTSLLDFMFNFFLTTHVIPIVMLGVLGLILVRKRLFVLFTGVFLIILFKVLSIEYRISFFLLLVLCLSAGLFYAKISIILQRLLLAFCIILFIYIGVILHSEHHDRLSEIYDGQTQKIQIDTGNSYLFTYKGPYYVHADKDTRVALVPFGYSRINAEFREVSKHWKNKNSLELKSLYDFFQIEFIVTTNPNLHKKYEFVEQTNYSYLKKINLSQEYPIYALNNSNLEVLEALYNPLEYEQSYYDIAHVIPQMSKFECVYDYEFGKNTIGFLTSCLNQPHLLKTAYHPLWGIDGGRVESFEDRFLVVYPEQEGVVLKFTPSWWMIVLYVLSLVTLLVYFGLYTHKE